MPAASDILQFMRGQLFEEPHLPKITFQGKTIVITGANTGLGFECAKQLAALNASTLVLGCRDLTKGEAAREQILMKAPSRSSIDVQVWQVDMASYASVRAFAKRLSDLPHLEGLIANAGISTNQYVTAENFESTLTVNVISTFLLSMLALPMLKETAAISKQPTHLTIVGSNVHAFADATQLQSASVGEVFTTLSDKSDADMAARYFLSKLVVMQCVRELAGRVSSNEVVINCPSPGWCKTELFRTDDGGFWGRNMLKLIGRMPDVGARCLTSAVAAGKETHGEYLSECRVKRTSAFVRSEQGQKLEKQMWNELMRVIGDIDANATHL